MTSLPPVVTDGAKPYFLAMLALAFALIAMAIVAAVLYAIGAGAAVIGVIATGAIALIGMINTVGALLVASLNRK